jgi:hypothetical protein
MRLRPPFFLILALAALLAVPAALGASTPRPLLLGFQDESSFLWSLDKQANLDRAAAAHASVVRVIANWSQIAPTRPSAPGNSNDPAYQFHGLDDLVWLSELRGMRVLLTIWGTPTWASATHKPNAAPKPADLGAFCSAIGSRYNGTGPQAPVGLYSIWNEPNLDQFLHPQFTAKGKDIGPQLYAGMGRACYAAIKKANPTAQVAMGDTSPRGHDRPGIRTQASHSPGRFAELVGKVRPRVKFDAWAHHPYADGFKGGPTSTFRWPNVGIGDLGKLELALRKDFGRKHVPLWVTEFAYQTKPEHPGALSYGQQASYLGKSIATAAAVPDVQMFIWYIFRDTAGERWQSGLIRKNGSTKPSYSAFAKAAAQYDVGNPTVTVTTLPNPVVPLSLVQLKAQQQPTDPPIGMTYRIYDPRRGLVGIGQTQATLDLHGQIKVALADFTPKPKSVYTVTFDVNDIHGDVVHSVVHLLAH